MSDIYVLLEFVKEGDFPLRTEFCAPSVNSAKMKARKLLQSQASRATLLVWGNASLQKAAGKDARFKAVN